MDWGSAFALAGMAWSLGALLAQRRERAGQVVPPEVRFLARWGVVVGTSFMAAGLAVRGDAPMVGMP